jgi:DNA-binding CsgD family transcriptional regulator
MRDALHGRERELRRVGGILAAAREGRSGVLVVGGEPGIGKTALLDLAAEQAAGMRLLRATGVESELELAFAGLHQLLWPVLDRIDRLAAPQAAALRGAFGLGPPPADRFLVAVAMLSLLAEVAEERPLLVLVDDLQWVDAASAESLAFAARRLAAEPVAMLLALREGAVADALSAQLPALPLPGLDRAAAGALLEARGVDVAPAVLERLVAETAGNPLALIELPALLDGEQLAGRRPLPAALPLNTRLLGAYLKRARGLPGDAQRLLVVAAAEDTGDLGVILAAGERLGCRVEALAAAESSALLSVAGGRVRFGHPLVRSAVYQGASFGERLAAHRALAEALRGEADEDRRTWHLAAATLGANEEVAAALERTAERARERQGLLAAASALERAATLSPADGARARRLAAAARLALDAGRPQLARALSRQARPLTDDPGLLADLAMTLGMAESSGDWEASVREFTRGGEAVLSSEPRLAALLFETASAEAQSGDDLAVIAGLHDRAVAALSLAGGTPPDAAAILRPQFVPGRPPDPGSMVADAASGLLWRLPTAPVVVLAGAEAELYPAVKQTVAGLRERGAVYGLVNWINLLGEIEYRLGHWPNSAAHGAEGLRLEREIDSPDWRAVFQLLALALAAARGRAEECRRLADQALAVLVPARHWSGQLAAAHRLALLDLGLGNAREALDRLLAPLQGEPWPGRRLIALAEVDVTVEAAARAGRPDLLAAVLDGLARHLGPRPPAWGRAQIELGRAVLGGDAEAEPRYEAAVAAGEEAGRPFPLARTRLLYGEWLRRGRRRVDARHQLRVAVETFDRLEAAPWAERARAELRATGETIRRHDLGVSDELTPQELQIVRLAAAGMTNREIGERLFLSPRTIGSHLYSAFPKLGIGSRAELRGLTFADAPPA